MTGPRVSWKGKLNALGELKYSLAFLDSLFLADRSMHLDCRTYPIINTHPRVLPDLRIGEFEHELSIRSLLIFNPGMQVARGKDDIVQYVSNLRYLRFKDGFIEILSTNFDDLLPVIFDAVIVCKLYNSRISYIEQKQDPRDLRPVKFA